MPDLPVIAALLLLVLLVESSPLVRIPLGLVLAIGLLATDADLLPVAAIGAIGVMLARLGLALAARRRGASGRTTPQQEALRRHLSSSSAYARLTFVFGALPAMPATFVFPLLGTMRAPLWPALLGTLLGRTPVLAMTTALFAWLGRLGGSSDRDATITLAVLAVALLVFRSIGLVDWAHRAETGRFRMRDPDAGAARMTAMFGQGADPGSSGLSRAQAGAGVDPSEADMLEGEVLGEEIVDDHDDHDRGSDDEPPGPPALPPTGLAPI